MYNLFKHVETSYVSSVDITRVAALPESEKLATHDCEGSTATHLHSMA